MAQEIIQAPDKVQRDKGKQTDTTSALAANRHWRELVRRYQELVDKDFRCGLTLDETQEIERLGADIDADEARLDPR